MQGKVNKFAIHVQPASLNICVQFIDCCNIFPVNQTRDNYNGSIGSTSKCNICWSSAGWLFRCCFDFGFTRSKTIYGCNVHSCVYFIYVYVVALCKCVLVWKQPEWIRGFGWFRTNRNDLCSDVNGRKRLHNCVWMPWMLAGCPHACDMMCCSCVVCVCMYVYVRQITKWIVCARCARTLPTLSLSLYHSLAQSLCTRGRIITAYERAQYVCTKRFIRNDLLLIKQ